MANRRMISKDIYETDNFSEMPNSAQSLYTHFILQADDDGFISNPRLLLRMYGANNDDLKLLIAKGFLIPFEDGVVAITHWKMMNTIRKERYTPTNYKDDFQKLELTDQKSYRLLAPIQKPSLKNVIPMDDQKTTACQTVCQTTGVTNGMTTGVTSGVQSVIPSVGKYSKGKVRSDKGKYIHPTTDSQTESPYSEIINYLNRKFSMRLNYDLAPTRTIIDDRMNEGYSIDDFKLLIDCLSDSNDITWNNEEEKKSALRPAKLFTHDNFTKYVDNSEKPKDPFNQPSNQQFTTESKVKGIINYINTIYSNEIAEGECTKLVDDDETKRILNLILSSNEEQDIIGIIKENSSDSPTPQDMLEMLKEDFELPF